MCFFQQANNHWGRILKFYTIDLTSSQSIVNFLTRVKNTKIQDMYSQYSQLVHRIHRFIENVISAHLMATSMTLIDVAKRIYFIQTF